MRKRKDLDAYERFDMEDYQKPITEEEFIKRARKLFREMKSEDPTCKSFRVFFLAMGTCKSDGSIRVIDKGWRNFQQCGYSIQMMLELKSLHVGLGGSKEK